MKKAAYLSIVSQEEDYTLTGFIESYKNIVEHLTSKFKVWNHSHAHIHSVQLYL